MMRSDEMINEFDCAKESTGNFKIHREAMQGFSIADIVRAYSCIDDLVIRLAPNLEERRKLLEDIDHIREPLADLINSLTTDYKCMKCGGWLCCSDLPQYDFVCPGCDENF